jgi:hypothetical protein
MTDYRRGFTENLNQQPVTTRNCSAITNSHVPYSSLQHALSLLSLLPSPVVAWYRLPTADVPLTLDTQTVPLPQVQASNNNSSHQPNCSSLMTSPTHLTPLCLTELHSVTVLLITSGHSPHRKHYSSVVVSFIEFANIYADRAENTIPLLLFKGCCLVTGVV